MPGKSAMPQPARVALMSASTLVERNTTRSRQAQALEPGSLSHVEGLLIDQQIVLGELAGVAGLGDRSR